MKIFIIGSAVIGIVIAGAVYALDTSPTEPTTSPTTVSNWVYPSQILLPVIIDTTKEDNKLEARLTKLQDAGVTLGLEKMILEGEATSSEVEDGGKEYSISWAGASLRKEDGGKISTYISKPLKSTVSANPALRGGDSFTAEGDPNELLEAWKRLQAMLEKEDKKEKESEERKADTPLPTKDFGSGAEQNSQPQTTQQSPNFQVKAEPVVVSTRDGCNMNVDLEQLVAIVQERTLQDGKEILGCQDTLTRYPLEKKYASCPVKIDTDAGKVYQQFTLSYNDPNSGGAVQVADCQADTDKSVALQTDTASCGLRHDFEKGISYQRAKKTYVDPQGNIQTVQDCEDTDVTYAQQTTYDGCSDIIDIPGMKAVHQKRIRINKNGEYQYISECAPDTADYAELQTEACTGSNRYTHDFGGGQSFLNQTILYTDTTGSRKDVQTCQPGTTTFQHLKDETVCPAINDDSTRQTTLYAKTYLEEETGKAVYLSDCQATSPAIPYVKTGDVWKIKSTVRKEFEPTAKDLSSIASQPELVEATNYKGIANCGPSVVTTEYYQWKEMYSAYTYKGLPISVNTQYTLYQPGPGIGKPRCYPQPTVNATYDGNLMCIAGPDASNWRSTDGIQIDPVNSTVTPTTVTTATLQNMTELPPENGRVYFRQSGSTPRSVTFTCSKGFCDMTTLLANPKYLRGDNSYYIDFETVTDTKYVCGDGMNLDGKDK